MTFEECFEICLKNKELISEFNRLSNYNTQSNIDLNEWKNNYAKFVKEFVFDKLN